MKIWCVVVALAELAWTWDSVHDHFVERRAQNSWIGFDPPGTIAQEWRIQPPLFQRFSRDLVELPGRGDDAISAERAAAILLDIIGDDERDALTFVEDAAGRECIDLHAQERRRSALRAQSAGVR